MSGTTSHSEHVSIEPALLPSEIEQLPDLTGYLKARLVIPVGSVSG